METGHHLKAALEHVLWIGGATDSGKTSVARAIARKYAMHMYHLDEYDREEPPGHWSRIDPTRHPHMHAAPTANRDWMWVHTNPQDLVRRWLNWAPERFQLVIEDLLALVGTSQVVAEGYGFTPDLVFPLLSSARQAIWLISTDEFKRVTYKRRGKGTFFDTSDPERARVNHIGRDLMLARYMRNRAEQLGLRVIEVDGSLSLDDVTAAVDSHFAPLLQRR